jgi:hypothetical protein
MVGPSVDVVPCLAPSGLASHLATPKRSKSFTCTTQTCHSLSNGSHLWAVSCSGAANA